jgi:hypothetical protein
MRRLILSLVLTAGLGGGASAQTPDPKVLSFKLPDQIEWKGDRVHGPLTVNLWGDPGKPGPYSVLVEWLPHQMSRPHYHLYDRYVTVVSGTWWVGTGPVFDPDKTTPMPAGSIVTHFAHEVHYDGAKDAPVIIQIAGMGPGTPIPAK